MLFTDCSKSTNGVSWAVINLISINDGFYLAGKDDFDSLGQVGIPILYAFRLYKKVEAANGTTTKLPSEAVRGTFLPDRVVLFGLRIAVRVYRHLQMFATIALGLATRDSFVKTTHGAQIIQVSI